MLLNGGEYNGQRLLGRMTVDMMFANHIGTGKPVYVRGDGYGFGLGARRADRPGEGARRAVDRHLDAGAAPTARSSGSIRVEELIPILMIQISPYSHFNIRPLFSVVASQSVIDSLADQKPKVMGYDTPR